MGEPREPRARRAFPLAWNNARSRSSRTYQRAGRDTHYPCGECQLRDLLPRSIEQRCRTSIPQPPGRPCLDRRALQCRLAGQAGAPPTRVHLLAPLCPVGPTLGVAGALSRHSLETITLAVLRSYQRGHAESEATAPTYDVRLEPDFVGTAPSHWDRPMSAGDAPGPPGRGIRCKARRRRVECALFARLRLVAAQSRCCIGRGPYSG